MPTGQREYCSHPQDYRSYAEDGKGSFCGLCNTHIPPEKTITKEVVDSIMRQREDSKPIKPQRQFIAYLSGDNLQELADAVNQKLGEGWRFQGQLTTWQDPGVPRQYCQAMSITGTEKEEDDESTK